MDEICEWKTLFVDTKRWGECKNQTAFGDRFCPNHQQIAEANEVSHVTPLAQIVESLTRLADIEEYKLRRTDRNLGTRMTVRDLLDDNRVVVTPKETT